MAPSLHLEHQRKPSPPSTPKHGYLLAAAQTSQPEVPYVPTTEEAVQAMLKLADVKKTDVIYDLGCGDGRIVIAAAKMYGVHGVGIDINPQRIQEAKENAKRASWKTWSGLKRMTFSGRTFTKPRW